MTGTEGTPSQDSGGLAARRRSKSWMVAAVAGIAVLVLVAVAFAMTRPSRDASGVSAGERQIATAWVAQNSQMWAWMQSHWDEMAFMHEHWGDTAWMQKHLADWSWMRDHWEAMAWMHTNWQGMAWMHTGGMMGVSVPGGMMGGGGG